MKTIRCFIFVLFLSSGLLFWDTGSTFSQTQWETDFKDFSEISLEKLLDVTVTSASKHEQGISQAPAFVTVITDKMIEAFNYGNVADAFTTSFVDKRQAYDGQMARSYLCTNFSLTLKKTAGLFDLSLFVKNLFDVRMYDPIFEDYYPVVLMKQDGRAFSIRTSFNL